MTTSSFGRVIWSEGMFLRPQHFQQLDRYFENLVRQSVRGLRAHSWGVSVVEIDRSLLEVGKLSVPVCAGLMPDGTFFRAPDEHAPPPIIEVAEDARNSLVFLSLGVEQPGQEDRGIGGAGNGASRWDTQEIEIYDTASESFGGRAPIRVGRLRMRLLLERDQREGWFCIPIARIREVTADKRVLLEDLFIPTCLDFAASTQLTAFMAELEGLLNQRGGALAGRVSATGRGGSAEIADFLLLQVVNRLQPVVAQLSAAAGIHPDELHLLLLGAAGELATFTAAGKRPAEFPPYRHEALTETFLPLFLAIRQSLSMVLDPTAVAIPLEERRFGIRVGIIHDRSLLDGAAFVLVVSADMDSELLTRTFRAQSKTGPVEKIRELVNLALPGVPLRPRPVAPRQLPYHTNAIYFELDTSSELWRELERSGGLAIHVAGDFPNLAIELWAIKR